MVRWVDGEKRNGLKGDRNSRRAEGGRKKLAEGKMGRRVMERVGEEKEERKIWRKEKWAEG